MILYILIGVSIITLVSIFVNYNLLKKVEKLEGIATNQASFISSFQNVVVEVNRRLTTIDQDGIFQADDDIGFFFQQVLNLNSALNEFASEES